MNNKQLAILLGIVILVIAVTLSKNADICFGFDGQPCYLKNHIDINKSR